MLLPVVSLAQLIIFEPIMVDAVVNMVLGYRSDNHMELKFNLWSLPCQATRKDLFLVTSELLSWVSYPAPLPLSVRLCLSAH